MHERRMMEAVVIGVSAGGMEALGRIIPALPAGFILPIIIVQHVAEQSDRYLVEYLGSKSRLTVVEAQDKEPLCAGHVYIAPAAYHLLIEPGRTLSLSVDARVNYSCPSIDVLFESAADVFGEGLAGIVLTGANADGSKGLSAIKAAGGIAIVQDPDDAEYAYMPRAAMAATQVDYVATLAEIAPLLMQLNEPERIRHGATV